MKKDGLNVVESVGKILAGMKVSYQRIQIEGHASYESPEMRGVVRDDDSATYRMLNWKLSADRAGSVMQVFIKKGVPDYKISAAARGHYHPVVGDPCNLSINSEDYKRYNSTVPQREQNRRINVLIMYGSEEAAE
jgi:flagellar motor protein MotB